MKTSVPGLQGSGTLHRIAEWWGPRPITQVAVIAAALGLFLYLSNNAIVATSSYGTGFDFLRYSANFQIGESSIIPFQAGDTYARAIIVGLINTLKVAVLGCVLATILGVLIGVAGLSSNLLLAGLVRWYIEAIRNTPLLLQLFFWIALAKALPPPRQAIGMFDAVFLTNRGVFIPGIVIDGTSWATWALLAVIVVAWAAFLVLARRRHAPATGLRIGFVTLAAIAAAGLLCL